MEISNRQDIDKLIAYSKSIQVGLIEDDFYDQYTPPEKHVYELETLPDIKLEEFEPNLNEDEMLKLLKQNVQSAKIKESVSSEHDSLDSSDSIERRSTPPKCKQQQQVDPQIQIHVQKSQTTVDMTEYNKVPEEVLQLLEGAKERKSMLGAAIKILKEPVCYCNPKENLLRSTFLTLNNTFKSMLPKVLQSYKLFEQAQLIIIIIIITSRDCLDTLTMLMHMKLDLLTMTLNSKQKWLLVPLTKKKKSFQLKPINYKPQSNDIQIFEKMNPNMILIEVLIIDQKPEKNVTTKMQLEKNSIVQDIFTQISKKNNQINQINYIIQLNDDDTLIDLDLRMPVVQLQNKKIQIKQKTWADQAEQQFVNSQRRDTITKHDDHADAPLNHIQAFKYEKFTVVKINERGKRQDRILGIDQFRIYNMNKKENLGLFERILNNKNSGTKFPQRLIEDIVDIRIAHQFLYITFKQENDYKELKFDTLDSKIAQKIFKKINFIRDFQIATQKYRASSQKQD